jgi:hypothetical protein
VKRLWIPLLMVLLIMGWSGRGLAADKSDIQKEIELLKERIQELEQRLNKQEAAGKEQAAKTEKSLGDKVGEALCERFGSLSIHGSIAGYWQGASKPTISGEEFRTSNGAGYSGDLELSFRPTARGEFFMRLHAGEGEGADKDLKAAGALFANLNTLADDNPTGQFMELLEAFYTQRLLEERVAFSIGKTHPGVFIDDNAYANDEKSQFVGKPFVNNPVLNSEDEYAPLVAIEISPLESLRLVVLAQSSSHGGNKDVWNNVQDQPFLATQLTYSPKIGDHAGHYRVYLWDAAYDHPDLTDPDKGRSGWGVGLSLDQEITEQAGVFARFGYHNKDVYPVECFWSAGASLKGLIPKRAEDELGIGIAGLVANGDLNEATADTGFLLTGDNEGTEYHVEAYYRVVISEFVAITPDVQYIVNPVGDTRNDDVFAAMLRAELSF